MSCDVQWNTFNTSVADNGFQLFLPEELPWTHFVVRAVTDGLPAGHSVSVGDWQNNISSGLLITRFVGEPGMLLQVNADHDTTTLSVEDISLIPTTHSVFSSSPMYGAQFLTMDSIIIAPINPAEPISSLRRIEGLAMFPALCTVCL